MHKFIILGDDIYTLDTVGERELAAKHMREAGVQRRPVYVGGPQFANSAGQDFCAEADGTWGWGFGDDETHARMTAAYRGEL